MNKLILQEPAGPWARRLMMRETSGNAVCDVSASRCCMHELAGPWARRLMHSKVESNRFSLKCMFVVYMDQQGHGLADSLLNKQKLMHVDMQFLVCCC